MTLPRRKSRGLSVDGVRYRWLVTPVSEFTLHLIVEHDGGVLRDHGRVDRVAGPPHDRPAALEWP